MEELTNGKEYFCVIALARNGEELDIDFEASAKLGTDDLEQFADMLNQAIADAVETCFEKSVGWHLLHDNAKH